MLRRNRDNLGIVLLFHHILATLGLENIPPVTLAVIGLQIALFMGFVKVPWKSLQDCCLSAYTFVERQEYYRLFSSVVEHSDSMHLYYNMASFAWKGIALENFMGSPFFFFMLLVFSLLTGLLSVGIYYVLSVLVSKEFMYFCGIGFSGVIFALKVVSNRVYPDVHPIIRGHRMRIPGGILVWLELILISYIAPGTSFVGHLSGILVGAAYSMGALQLVFDIFGLFMGYNPHRSRSTRGRLRTYQFFQHSMYTGYVLQMPKIPSIGTAVSMCLLTAIFFRDFLPYEISQFYSYVTGSCVNAYSVLDAGRYLLVMTAPLHTLNRVHLGYCLLTLWKVGDNIERQLGTMPYAIMLSILTAATGLVYVGLVKYVLVYGENILGVSSYDMKYKCFTGPTGVLLALKVLYAYLFPNASANILLINLPRFPFVGALVGEILILYLAFPQAWAIGNIAGVLAGLLYIILM